MADLNVSKLREMLNKNEYTREQVFQKCWIYLQEFIHAHPVNATIPSNLIEDLENSFNGFKNYLISNNYASNESQISQSLTELRMEQFQIQDETYKKIHEDLNSTIYITHVVGKKPKQKLIAEASPILYASLFLKTDDHHFIHFINIFKNCISKKTEWPSRGNEYTIPRNVFESFADLFPEYIELLKKMSSELYVNLYNEKEPYDRKLQEIETQITKKVKEIMQTRISYIILPTGDRMKVLYED